MRLHQYRYAVMKFQALFLIYLFGVEAKSKRPVGSRADKYHHRDGFRSLLGSEQPLDNPYDVNHGNIAARPPKYGHFGLKSSSGDDIVDGAKSAQNVGGNGIFGAPGFNGLPLEQTNMPDGSKVKQSLSNSKPESIFGNNLENKNNAREQWEKINKFQEYEESLHANGPSRTGLPGSPFWQNNIQGQYPNFGLAADQSGFSGSLLGQSGLLGQAAGQSGLLGAQYGQSNLQGQYSNIGPTAGQSGLLGTPYGLSNFQEQYSNMGQVQNGLLGTLYGQSNMQGQYSTLGQAAGLSGLPGYMPGQSNIQAQYSTSGLPGINYQLAPGILGRFGLPYGESTLVQFPSVNQRYILGYIPGQIGQLNYPFGQNNFQAQYSRLVQPTSYYGAVPGQSGQWGFLNGQSIQAQQKGFGQPGSYYNGAAAGQGVESVAYSGQNGFGPYSNTGQSSSYYGGVNAQVQNGQLGNVGQYANTQGLYSGFVNPSSYLGAGNNILNLGGQSGVTSLWNMYGGGMGMGQLSGAIYGTPLSSQLGQTMCPFGYSLFAGRCVLGIATSAVSNGLVPGLFGGVEKAVSSAEFNSGEAGSYQQPAVRVIGRYITPGFYYPPPQHLNSDPNIWDPVARYYFAFDNNPQESPKDVPNSPPNPPEKSFPISYVKI